MDYLQRIKEREEVLDSFRKRQDADKDLLYLSKYIMADAYNKAVPDIINVTLNRPAVFAANVIAALGKVSEQIVVESETKSLDAAYIEQFQRACFLQANSLLRKRNKPQVNPYFDEQTCIRGGGVALCAFQMIDDRLVPNIIPWDLRFVTWEMGDGGLDYAAYSTTRKKSELKAEYPMFKDRGSKTMAIVRDVWDKTHNEIWIENEKVLEQSHAYGYVPVVLAFVPLGSMLADSDAISHQGESIFFLIRTVIPELNRLVSIMQTLNLKAVKPPIKAKKRGAGEAPDYNEVMASGAATSMEPEEDIAPIDYGDAKRSAELAFNMFNQALSEGSLPPEAFGSIDLALSNVALITLGERAGQVFWPRLETKGFLNQGLAEMFTQQCIQIGGSLEIGTPGHKRSFNTEKLKGEYETIFKYFPNSPKGDLAKYAMAAQAKGVGLTQKAIDTDILQREDPEGDERQRRWEQAEQLSPAIRLHRIIKSLIEDAERGDDDAEFEAELLSMEMGVNLQQMLTGQVGQTPEVEETPKPNPLMLGPGGNEVTSAKKASDERLSPLTPVKE